MSRAPLEVLIGGSGLAATAAAIRLSDLGFQPVMVAVARPSVGGIEAIPESAWPLVSELGLTDVLRQAGAQVVEGFENRWFPDAPVTLHGRWIHVDRDRLAASALREAVRRGARVRSLTALPSISMTADGVTCVLDGREMAFHAAIDATGRAAVWSRPVQRPESSIADVYDVPIRAQPRGRIARVGPEHNGVTGDAVTRSVWAYRVGTTQRVSVGIISPGGLTSKAQTAGIWQALDVPPVNAAWSGRRAAAQQWSERPVDGRRIAIGDAAHAYAPLAGQGIRFALASARIASSVVCSWAISPESGLRASVFYDDFVHHSVRRHRRWLTELADRPSSAREIMLPDFVSCAAPVGEVGLMIESRVVPGAAVQLSDGEYVRWIGGVDVMEIHDLATNGIATASLIDAIARRCTRRQAEAAVRWCVQHDLLRDCTSA
jgi:flavin-dependent dehydrogenase